MDVITVCMDVPHVLLYFTHFLCTQRWGFLQAPRVISSPQILILRNSLAVLFVTCTGIRYLHAIMCCDPISLPSWDHAADACNRMCQIPTDGTCQIMTRYTKGCPCSSPHQRVHTNRNQPDPLD